MSDLDTTVTFPGTVFDDGITDRSAVDNIEPVVIDGFGGPHAVFDKDHYKGQARFPGKLVEFNAAQGAIVGHGYTWAVVLISYNDDNTTEMITWPPTDLAVKSFAMAQMQGFIQLYQPKRMYLVSLNLDIDPTTFPWSFA